MKEYVRIQSSINISVTSGLSKQDFTKQDSDLPDRMKIKPTWPKTTVLIKAGAGLYPAEIAEWNSVKACVRNKIMTIGEFVDDAGGDTELVKLKRKLMNEEAKTKTETNAKAKVKETTSSLDELAEETDD